MENKPANPQRSTIVRSLSGLLLAIALVFLFAGRLDYWQGLLYLVILLSTLLITFLLVKKNLDLMNERLKPGKGIIGWDMAYLASSTVLYIVMIALAALDTGRFVLSPRLPAAVYAVSATLYIIGYSIFLWARLANNFFSSVVRIQTERGHTVCDKGPYRYIRHPGYAGSAIYTAVTPLIFGSLWALIPALISVAMLIVRTVLEDNVLEKELPGYNEYKNHVRYRLVPFIF